MKLPKAMFKKKSQTFIEECLGKLREVDPTAECLPWEMHFPNEYDPRYGFYMRFVGQLPKPKGAKSHWASPVFIDVRDIERNSKAGVLELVKIQVEIAMMSALDLLARAA